MGRYKWPHSHWKTPHDGAPSFREPFQKSRATFLSTQSLAPNVVVSDILAEVGMGVCVWGGRFGAGHFSYPRCVYFHTSIHPYIHRCTYVTASAHVFSSMRAYARHTCVNFAHSAAIAPPRRFKHLCPCPAVMIPPLRFKYLFPCSAEMIAAHLSACIRKCVFHFPFLM